MYIIPFELKESYYKQACRNLEYAEHHAGSQGALFETGEPQSIEALP